MEFHPVASIFPMMSVEEFNALKESLRARGQRNPIYTYEGKIVDGRNRYQACVELGIKPWLEEWHGKGLLVDFVWDLNAERRQLSENEKLITAAKYAIERQKEARQRQGTNKTNKALTSSNSESIDSEFEYGRSANKAADKFQISAPTVIRAVRVVKKGAPELVNAVSSGTATVFAATQIATLPIEEQQKVVAAGPDEIVTRANSIRDSRRTGIHGVRAGTAAKSIPPKLEAKNGNSEIKSLGVGMDRAHEAINCLRRIPNNDGLRKRAFQFVKDWLRDNL